MKYTNKLLVAGLLLGAIQANLFACERYEEYPHNDNTVSFNNGDIKIELKNVKSKVKDAMKKHPYTVTALGVGAMAVGGTILYATNQKFQDKVKETATSIKNNVLAEWEKLKTDGISKMSAARATCYTAATGLGIFCLYKLASVANQKWNLWGKKDSKIDRALKFLQNFRSGLNHIDEVVKNKQL